MKHNSLTAGSFAAVLNPLAAIAASLAGALPAGAVQVPFTERVISTTADSANSVFATDLDGDGDADVLSASVSDDKIAWYENLRPCGFDSDCDGDVDLHDFAKLQACFTGAMSAPDFQPPDNPQCLPTFDSNADGAIDLADIGAFESLFRGPGVHVVGPLFLQQRFVAIPVAEPVFVATGDLDGDGDLDLVVGERCCGDFTVTGSDRVSVLLNNGDGTFTAAMRFELAGGSAVSIATGDLDGDGDLDIAAAGSVLLNNGDGTFQAALNFAAGDCPNSVALGDLDGDNDLDLAVANFRDPHTGVGGGVFILLNNGDGTFAEAMNLNVGNVGVGPVLVATIDLFFDLDGEVVGLGDLDLVVAHSLGVSLMFKFEGMFVELSDICCRNISLPQFVSAGDLDGDGDLDLAVADGNSVCIEMNVFEESFAFTERCFSFSTEAYPRSIAMGDLDGDGDLDMVVTYERPFAKDNVSVLLNNGDGTFEALMTLSAGFIPCSVAMGDMDGDGDLDLVVANLLREDIFIFLNQRFR